jgi:ketosteroid isomerase-like protein
MRLILVVAIVAMSVAEPLSASASDTSDIVAVVQVQNDAGNKGERSRYVSYCTKDAVVVDHVPPFLFQGPMACGDEYDAVVGWGKQNDIPMDRTTFQKVFDPAFVQVQGDVAYAVFPVKAWFKQNGSIQEETVYLTAGLRRQAHNWRIARLIFASLGWKAAGPRQK